MGGPDSRVPFPGLVLAGGRSSRMGEDKAGLMLAGWPLLRHAAERLAPQVTGLAVNAAPGTPPLPFPVIPDSIAGQPGPLAGILAGLEHFRQTRETVLQDMSEDTPETRQGPASHILTVPVDSPFFPADLGVRLMDGMASDEDIAIAVSQDRDHPVFGLWPAALAADLRDFVLNDTRRSVRGFLSRHRVRRVDFPLLATAAGALDPFFNINRPEDLRQADIFLEHLTS